MHERELIYLVPRHSFVLAGIGATPQSRRYIPPTMKSLPICSVVAVIGACCFTSCAPKETATSGASSYSESGGKNVAETQRPPMVKDTGPRQGTDDTGPRQDN